MYIDIKVEVTPVVLAFLRNKFKIDPYLELSQDNQFGIFLYNSLSSVKAAKRIRNNELPKHKYTEVLVLRLSEDTFRRRGHYISSEKKKAFNRMVQFQIDDLFYHWVHCCSDIHGMTYLNAFFSFREKFNLNEDELTLKNMEQKYFRQRNRLSA